MWIVELETGLWIAETGTTTDKQKAWVMPDMPTVQKELKKVRRLIPYKDAMVISAYPDDS